MKRLLIALALLALIGCSSEGTKDSAPLELTFSPPDSVTYTEMSVSERTQKFGDAEPMVDSTRAYAVHTLLATETGYDLQSRTDSMFTTRNGESLEDPTREILPQITFVRVMDRDGVALDILGYDRFYALIDSSLDPQFAARMRQNMPPRMMVERELLTWNTKLGQLNSLTAGLNERVYESSPMPLPNGDSLASFKSAEIVDTFRTDGVLCARIETHSHTDLRALAALVSPTFDELKEIYGVSDSVIAANADKHIVISEGVETVVEVETMLMHSESRRQEVDIDQAGSGGQVMKVNVVETNHAEYTY